MEIEESINEVNCNDCFLFQLFMFNDMSVNVKQWYKRLKNSNNGNFDIRIEKLSEITLKLETDLIFLHKTLIEEKRDKQDNETTQYFEILHKEAETRKQRLIADHKAFLDSIS